MNDERQFCTFSVDSMCLGVDVLRVQEVIRYQEMTSVPTSPEVVSGLINLRGQIVTAIDLRARMGLPPLPEDRKPMNIVVRTDEGAVSLLVDEIGDVLEMQPADYDRPPTNLSAGARELISGVYKLKDKLMLVLDTDKTLAAA